MGDILAISLAALGVLVPITGFLWEFIIVGRKRLGYRVQMDTIATDEVHSQYAGALQELRREDGHRLIDPSFVLLRIENNGLTHVDTGDYAVLDHDRAGIHVRFPGRTVVGTVVTELSDDFLRHSFSDESGLRVHDDVIELPKVPLNPGAHYKVLAALERSPENTADSRAQFPAPQVVGGIKGGVGGGGIQETISRTGTSWQAISLVGFLVLVIVAQLIVSLSSGGATPLDCAKGRLTVTGSTAFGPVLTEATRSYAATCPGARFALRVHGSVEGVRALGQADPSQAPGMLAFSDGPKQDGLPMLVPRPVAFSIFTLVVNKDAGVQDLSLAQIGRLYEGEITNWEQVGGKDQPVRLVGRTSDSGTRRAFERRILHETEPAHTSDNCRDPAPIKPARGTPQGIVRCEKSSTAQLLEAVARTPGAFGYSEAGEAARRQDLVRVRIDGHQATLSEADHAGYPFWETEYAYTYGEPKPGSLAASFLRYLTNQVGKDIIRFHGQHPCGELENAVLCQPS